jgi:site-specific recombinase XerD
MPARARAKSRNVTSELAEQVIGPDRPKDFLTPAKIDKLLKATRTSRHHFRDHALIRLMYRHGLRVSEAINLRRQDADLKQHRLTFKRLKHGFSVPHPIDGETVRVLKRYLAARGNDDAPWLFLSERRGKLTRQAVNYLLLEIGFRADLGRVHPHMLRHACGYALADKGTDFRLMQDYLGHKNPRHTAHYTRTSPARFNRIWD